MTVSAFPRILGWLTLGYGAFTLLRPTSLVHAADLEPHDRGVTRSGQALGRVIGVRDVLSGAAMVAAAPGVPLQAAIAARVASDASDVVGFGLSAPAQSKAKVVAIAGGWGLLCAASMAAARTRQ